MGKQVFNFTTRKWEDDDDWGKGDGSFLPGRVKSKARNKSSYGLKELAARKELTEAEIALWGVLKHKVFGVTWRKQYAIHNCILDFYCPSKRIAIEVDGGYHLNETQQRRDWHRDYFLSQKKIKTIRITNEDVLTSVTDCLDKIHKKIKEL